MRRTPGFDDVVAGAAGGAVSTAAMTLAMAVARLLGSGGQEPPRRIAAAFLDLAGIQRGRTEETAAALVLHQAFGAGAGVGYRLLRRMLATPGPAVLLGMGWGLAVWAISYAGWVPALRLLPPPSADRPDRQVRLVAAHLVYGAVLGPLVEPRDRDHAAADRR